MPLAGLIHTPHDSRRYVSTGGRNNYIPLVPPFDLGVCRDRRGTDSRNVTRGINTGVYALVLVAAAARQAGATAVN